MKNPASLPIGVFDSGMGGLTVLAALRKHLPAEHFVYLGDTARLPYGTKSPATVTRYAGTAAATLVDRGVKALVIACNTASAFALSALQRQFAPLPVFGVVEPGAQAAALAADDAGDGSGVLVLATESTISGGAYQRALLPLLRHAPVYGRACPLWVTLAEQGPLDPQFIHTVLAYALRGFETSGPSTVLLGCTHFPVFKPLLQQLFGELVETGQRRTAVSIVDSADTTARWVAEGLREQALLVDTEAGGSVAYLATDGAPRFKSVGSHFLGAAIDEVALVDL
ncbi:MAG: glutamate racemase [bacterium]